MSLTSRADEIIRIATSEETPEELLDKLLSEHLECYEHFARDEVDAMCDVCASWMENDDDTLLQLLAGNSNLSAETQVKIVEAASTIEGGHLEAVLWTLAINPSVCASIKVDYLLDIDSGLLWQGLEELESLYIEVSNNPGFTPADLKEFKKKAETWGLDL